MVQLDRCKSLKLSLYERRATKYNLLIASALFAFNFDCKIAERIVITTN